MGLPLWTHCYRYTLRLSITDALEPMLKFLSAFTFGIAAVASLLLVQTAAAQSPYRLQCDTIDKSDYPILRMRMSIDSGFQEVQNLRDSDFSIYDLGYRYTPRIVPGTCSHDSLSLMLVIDNSMSMQYTDMGGGTSRLQACQNAATNFLTRLDMPPDEAGLITFSRNARLNQNFTTQRSMVSQAVSSMSTSSNTNLTAPTRMALSMLRLRKGKRVLLLITDGNDNTGDNFARATAGMVDTAKQDSIVIYSIGIYPNSVDGMSGRLLGEPNLQNIALPTGGRYYWAPTATQLSAIYDSIYDNFLRQVCTLQFATPICDSGVRSITLTFQRAAGADQCTETFVTTTPAKTWCNCTRVTYSPGSVLMPAYPNPVDVFHRATMKYHTAHYGHVQIGVYNALGMNVATPVDEMQEAGDHSVELAGSSLPAGMYFYKMINGGDVSTRSLTITR